MINGKSVICISNDSNHRATNGMEPRDLWLNDFYCEAVDNAGAVIVITGERGAEDYADLCDGLILSGGADIEPEFFGETILNDSVRTDPKRTAFEYPLAKAFMERKKPILTICRGFQVLSCFLGGTLYQDLPEQLGFVHFDTRIFHPVITEPGSVMHELFGKEFRVNSFHHQAIRDLGSGLRVTARSVEGIIEAYEHESLPIIGTQFHPERMSGQWCEGKTPDFAPLFKHFVDMTKK